jgi:flagellar basal body-associated protein FliL
MSDEKKPAEAAPPAEGAAASAAAGAAPAPKSGKKKSLVMGGGQVGLIALAWILSMVAVPAGPHKVHVEEHHIAGPFMADISPSSGFQVNLSGDGGKHYLSLKLNVEVDAFEEAYATARTKDPLHLAKLTDSVIRTAAQKTKGELDSAVGREVFRDELRVALDPVLFPVHVGNDKAAEGAHEASRVKPGRSAARSTMRGFYYDHALTIDATRKAIKLDDGEEVIFQGDETDLFVSDARGKGVYVDVGGLAPEFAGQVRVGTFGRVRNVYFNTFLTQ